MNASVVFPLIQQLQPGELFGVVQLIGTLFCLGGSVEEGYLQFGYGGLSFHAGPMAYETLLDNVHDLSDLELAALICLIAQEHCIIDTEPDALDDLVEELVLVCRHSLSTNFKSPTRYRWHQKHLAFRTQ